MSRGIGYTWTARDDQILRDMAAQGLLWRGIRQAAWEKYRRNACPRQQIGADAGLSWTSPVQLHILSSSFADFPGRYS